MGRLMGHPVGVRLHHPTLRNCTFTIEQQDVIYPTPFECPMCQRQHIFKTFHLQLNEHGDVCVHPDIYELFKAKGIVGELSATKEVTPAPTVLYPDGDPTSPIIVSREFGNIRLPGMNGKSRV
jgi:hypothetical protein